MTLHVAINVDGVEFPGVDLEGDYTADNVGDLVMLLQGTLLGHDETVAMVTMDEAQSSPIVVARSVDDVQHVRPLVAGVVSDWTRARNPDC